MKITINRAGKMHVVSVVYEYETRLKMKKKKGGTTYINFCSLRIVWFNIILKTYNMVRSSIYIRTTYYIQHTTHEQNALIDA